MPLMPLRQGIEGYEIDRFLEFLFANVAKRPAPLGLKEAAAVVRYLQWLTSAGLPLNAIRGGKSAIEKYRGRESPLETRVGAASTNELARIIWNELFQFGSFRTASKAQVLGFLRLHAKTYLDTPCYQKALQFVETHDIAEDAPKRFGPPSLKGRHLNVPGPGNPYQQDDLTERLYVADLVLRDADVPQQRRRMCDVLKQIGVSRENGEEWGPEHINSRVKAFRLKLERLIAQEVRGQARIKAALEERSAAMVNRWVSGFRWAVAVADQVSADGRENG